MTDPTAPPAGGYYAPQQPVAGGASSAAAPSYNTPAPQDTVGTSATPNAPQPYQAYNPQDYAGDSSFQQTPSQAQALSAPPPTLPPRRMQSSFGDDDPSNPIHYTRDPHRLIAYLVPFPKPKIHSTDKPIPDRFLIYTPPPPPLEKPKEGEKEDRMHKVQRKWEEEVRAAKTSTAKTASWQGVKSKATKGIDWAMGQVKSSNLEFLNRIHDDKGDKHSDDGITEGSEVKKTVGLEEMILVYPNSIPGSEAKIREEFVNSMLRSKSKAQRDAVIATGMLPVAFAIDMLAVVIWPFGGLLEVDGVWAYSSIRGAKTARSTTKRLTSTGDAGKHDENQLRLTFTPSQRLAVLSQYLASRCHEKDPKMYPSAGVPPTETDVLEAVGWSPSRMGDTKNWEDERWETQEVKDDLRNVMGKGAKEWEKWCKTFEKDPEKALKK